MTNNDLKAELKRLHVEEGMPLIKAAEQLKIGRNTAYRWAKDGDFAPRSQDRSKECRQCSKNFVPSRAEGVFCSRACTNEWQREQAKDTIPSCPCGEPIAYERRHYAKYCNDEHRYQYGPAGGPKKDSENYKTFNCLTCGKEITRYKKYGNGHLKYCSNECAQKLTKVKHHITFKNGDVVLDSNWEGLFWCMAKVAKLPIERFDRSKAIEWKPGQWYAPDFWMPSVQWATDKVGAAVEVKGHEDPEDQTKWAAFRRETSMDLIVIDQYRMEHLSAHNFADTLRIACGYDNHTKG